MIEIGNTVRLKSNNHKMTISFILDEVVYIAGKTQDKRSYQCIYFNDITGLYVHQYFPENTIVKDGK
jgi:uncharacterized protein YodC (DUF2158 family)